MMMSRQQVLEGTCEEVRAHDAELAGRHVKLFLSEETASAVQSASVETEFKQLVEQWCKETAMFSMVERKAMHPSYQRIIGMGEAAIPLILNEMAQRSGHWFWALHAITGENPAPPEHAGNVQAMTDDWLRWGRENRYIRDEYLRLGD
jgi:hypothetical protein